MCVLPLKRRRRLFPPRSPRPVHRRSIPTHRLQFYGVSRWSLEPAEPTRDIYIHIQQT